MSFKGFKKGSVFLFWDDQSERELGSRKDIHPSQLTDPDSCHVNNKANVKFT